MDKSHQPESLKANNDLHDNKNKDTDYKLNLE